MSTRTSRALTLAGLGALAAVLLVPAGRDAGSWAAALPLGVLAACSALRLPRWAIATAIVMLPYFAYAVMELLVNPSWRRTAGVFAALTILVFLAALDAERRR